MRKLFLFMMVSLDGFFEGPNHDLGWHNVDKEFVEFAIEQLKETDLILFGRKTYEMMASFWPTDKAKDDPDTAKLMNYAPKIVVSKTLEKADWNNTKLIKDNIESEIRRLKDQPGKEIAVFGSNELAVSLLEMGLLDELRIMINPVAIGSGTRLFSEMKNKQDFQLLKSRVFKSGNILLYYKPLRKGGVTK